MAFIYNPELVNPEDLADPGPGRHIRLTTNVKNLMDAIYYLPDIEFGRAQRTGCEYCGTIYRNDTERLTCSQCGAPLVRSATG